MSTFKNTIINDTGYLNFPQGTTAQRPASSVTGMMRFNTTIQGFEYYNGATWVTNVPSYVTSGLYCYLDCASTTSYPGSGTTWFDLSGNGYNFTMRGSLTYSSTLGFSGFNDASHSAGWYRATTPWPTNLKTGQGGNGYTTIVWAKCNGSGYSWQKLIGNGDDVGYIDLYVSITNTVYRAEDGSSLYYNNAISVANDSFSMGDGVWRQYVSTNLNGGYASNPPDNFGIGNEGDAQYTYPFNGNIAIFMLYNKVLTAEEITQNYNYFKNRFA